MCISLSDRLTYIIGYIFLLFLLVTFHKINPNECCNAGSHAEGSRSRSVHTPNLHPSLRQRIRPNRHALLLRHLHTTALADTSAVTPRPTCWAPEPCCSRCWPAGRPFTGPTICLYQQQRSLVVVVPGMTSYPAEDHWTASHHHHTTANLLETVQSPKVSAGKMEQPINAVCIWICSPLAWNPKYRSRILPLSLGHIFCVHLVAPWIDIAMIGIAAICPYSEAHNAANTTGTMGMYQEPSSNETNIWQMLSKSSHCVEHDGDILLKDGRWAIMPCSFQWQHAQAIAANVPLLHTLTGIFTRMHPASDELTDLRIGIKHYTIVRGTVV